MNFNELYIVCDNIMDDDVFSLYIADCYIGEFTAESLYCHGLYGLMRITKFNVKKHEIRL